MVRRSLTLAVVINLLVLVPLPLLPCAILSGLNGPCQCQMMNSGSMLSKPAGSSAAISCSCVQVGAPFPNAIQSMTSPAPALVATGFVRPSQPISAASRQAFPRMLIASQLGPPGGRVGLHVFLI